MSLFSLILYGAINVIMVLSYLLRKGAFYQFPFWAGMIALGWFYPQAIGGYYNESKYPGYAYEDAMLFASICTLAMWLGFELALRRRPTKASWLDAPFDKKKLYLGAAMLCLFGFFFEWKLWSLPDEVLAQSQWSGAAVKYLFLASVFKIGFISLWLLYLSQSRLLAPKLLVFLIPCLLLMLEAAVLRGRRAGMMDLIGYIVLGLWFVRRIVIPRWFIITGLVCGLILINGIHTYRMIMKNKSIPLSKRLSKVANADYLATSKRSIDSSGYEFENYLYFRQAYADTGYYDYGSAHWNRFVFNYVPAQLLGSDFKESLMLHANDEDIGQLAEDRYGHSYYIGTTDTGYTDAFGSFGWLGAIKFLLIGSLMGILYRHAMMGSFLGQLLYMFSLSKGMQSVSHGTNDILIRVWIYFFTLGYPLLYWARERYIRNPSIYQQEPIINE